MTDPAVRADAIEALKRMARGGSACPPEETRATALLALRALGVSAAPPPVEGQTSLVDG